MKSNRIKNERYIRDLFRYVKTNSILVIDKDGALRRVYCPFRVEVLEDMPPLTKGDVVFVEAVRMTIEIKEIYIIEGSKHLHFKHIGMLFYYLECLCTNRTG